MKFGRLYAYCVNCGVRRIITANVNKEFCSVGCIAEWERKMARSIIEKDAIGIDERTYSCVCGGVGCNSCEPQGRG